MCKHLRNRQFQMQSFVNACFRPNLLARLVLVLNGLLRTACCRRLCFRQVEQHLLQLVQRVAGVAFKTTRPHGHVDGVTSQRQCGRSCSRRYILQIRIGLDERQFAQVLNTNKKQINQLVCHVEVCGPCFVKHSR